MLERFGERMEGMVRLFLRGVEELEEIGLEVEVRVDVLEVDSGKDDEERSMRSDVTGCWASSFELDDGG